MINLPLNIEGFYFDIIENPRPSDYEMGEEKCNMCGCHTSYYVNIGHDAASPGNGWGTVNICKSCLTGIVDFMNRRMLDDIKKRAEGNVVPGEKGTRKDN